MNYSAEEKMMHKVMMAVYESGIPMNFRNTGEMIFSMDVDVNRPVSEIETYEVEGIKIRGVSVSQMIADKLSVVSSDNPCRYYFLY